MFASYEGDLRATGHRLGGEAIEFREGARDDR